MGLEFTPERWRFRFLLSKSEPSSALVPLHIAADQTLLGYWISVEHGESEAETVSQISDRTRMCRHL